MSYQNQTSYSFFFLIWNSSFSCYLQTQIVKISVFLFEKFLETSEQKEPLPKVHVSVQSQTQDVGEASSGAAATDEHRHGCDIRQIKRLQSRTVIR